MSRDLKDQWLQDALNVDTAGSQSAATDTGDSAAASAGDNSASASDTPAPAADPSPAPAPADPASTPDPAPVAQRRVLRLGIANETNYILSLASNGLDASVAMAFDQAPPATIAPSGGGGFVVSFAPVAADAQAAGSVTYSVAGDDKFGAAMTFAWSWSSGSDHWEGVIGGPACEGCDLSAETAQDLLTFTYAKKGGVDPNAPPPSSLPQRRVLRIGIANETPYTLTLGSNGLDASVAMAFDQAPPASIAPSGGGGFVISFQPVAADAQAAGSVTYTVDGDDKTGMDMTFSWSWPRGCDHWEGVIGGSACDGCDMNAETEQDLLTFTYAKKDAAAAN